LKLFRKIYNNLDLIGKLGKKLVNILFIVLFLNIVVKDKLPLLYLSLFFN